MSCQADPLSRGLNKGDPRVALLITLGLQIEPREGVSGEVRERTFWALFGRPLPGVVLGDIYDDFGRFGSPNGPHLGDVFNNVGLQILD